MRAWADSTGTMCVLARPAHCGHIEVEAHTPGPIEAGVASAILKVPQFRNTRAELRIFVQQAVERVRLVQHIHV